MDCFGNAIANKGFLYDCVLLTSWPQFEEDSYGCDAPLSAYMLLCIYHMNN